jgi:3-keto-L-gulonate-6-phosphate decarboxylase
VYATAHKYNIKSVMKSCSKYTEKFAYDTTGVSTLKSPVFWIKEAAKYEVHHF